jgi:DNA mismatch endonuclease (patch repair protein)
MPDVFTKEKRSAVMSRIRGRGNKDTELALVKLLRAARITGWRRHMKLMGRPDFAFRKQRVVIFVDGCFWHGCPRHSNVPVNNRDFWIKKLTANRTRDRMVTKELKRQGWSVIRVWEHEFRASERLVGRILRKLG